MSTSLPPSHDAFHDELATARRAAGSRVSSFSGVGPAGASADGRELGVRDQDEHLIDEVMGELAADDNVRARARELVARSRSTGPHDSGPVPVGEAVSELTGRMGRYTFGSTLGRGGMGLVVRVHDHRLNRSVAMKVLRPDRAGRKSLRARFIEEAQTTAQLEHPGVVPVYDFGWLPDGRAYYTMREVRGATLADVITEVHQVSGPKRWEASESWTFRGLVNAFRLACEAVAYAHSRGVIHRDLKPENILLGEFGEVYVVDWGLARLMGELEVDDAVAVDPTDVGGDDIRRGDTRIGAKVGTPGFMAPEQKAGDHDILGPEADVFSLGVVLFQLLTNRRCEPKDPRRTRKAQARVFNRRPHRRRVPSPLRRICLRATAPDPDGRYADGRALADAISRWLEGAERRERALALVKKADGLRPHIARTRHKKRELSQMAAQWLERVPAERPVADKRQAWKLEDDAAEAAAEIERAEIEYVELLTSALQHVPSMPEARTRLARFYRRAHARAEDGGDLSTAARMEARLRTVDDGTHAAWLEGHGALSLATEPPGATVRLFQYELADRRLVPIPLAELGPTPVVEHPLPMGRYVAVVEHPDREPVRYPIWIPRCHHWSGRPPGAEQAPPLVLPARGSLGRDDLYVPAGWCRIGERRRSRGALSAGWMWVDDFVMKRFAVTHAEYLAFLEDLVSLGRDRDALLHAPRAPGTDDTAGALLYDRGADGRFRAGDGPRAPDPLSPVVNVSHDSATAYAAWVAERTGLPWRLPGELEWEKAARGVDGRRYPWGDHFDPTWACVRDTHPEDPRVAPVDSFPVDESPYGVRGLAGNVREWCADVYRRDGPHVPELQAAIATRGDGRARLRVDRGGCWAESGADGAAASRRDATPARARAPWLGIRLVRSVS